MSARWSVEQVEAVAVSPASVTAAQSIASPTNWQATGADDEAVWGSCLGSGAEPYDTTVDHVAVGFRCSCPSRQVPCKHAIALLLLWVRGQVPAGTRPSGVQGWIERRRARSSGSSGSEQPAAEEPAPAPGEGDSDTVPPEPPPADPLDRDRERDERVARMMAGLAELDRWLDDRMRTGLGDPALAQYATWDSLAARLVDAQAGSLANRIRRLAGLVGASPSWHAEVLAELGMLHLLTQAGRRLGDLPGPLADDVATAVGWQVRQADVLAGVPETDSWVVAGRSDTREDRIEVRRHWLRGERSGRWALALSFAAYQQSLDDSLVVGSAIEADLHRYPGRSLRALVGPRHGEPVEPAHPPARSVADACAEVGGVLADAPWLDRMATTVHAFLARSGDKWVLSDEAGSLPLHPAAVDRSLASLLAVSAGAAVDVTVEWTAHGVVPLAVHLGGRTVDVGPRADASFVSAA